MTLYNYIKHNLPTCLGFSVLACMGYVVLFILFSFVLKKYLNVYDVEILSAILSIPTGAILAWKLDDEPLNGDDCK